MRIQSFVKRLNATELGLGVTKDSYIAIPGEVDLSGMLTNQQAMTIYDRKTGCLFDASNSNIKYVQTGQNNQERISGLGQYYVMTDAKVGDEILIERIDVGGKTSFTLDLHHRQAIVFQKNREYVEILPNEHLDQYAAGNDYILEVVCEGVVHVLEVKFIKEAKKKKTSPKVTKFYDLIVDGDSILSKFSYQEYVEILMGDMRLGKMKTYIYSVTEMEDFEA